MTTQLDLFTPIQLHPPGPAEERRSYNGNWDGDVSTTHPCQLDSYGDPDRCQPTVYTRSFRCRHWERGCFCVGNDLYYRGACLKCGWYGDVRDSENHASEDAQDHAWPGWRDLPITYHKMPEYSGGKTGEKAKNAWIAALVKLHPPGWIEAGGPFRTQRTQGGTRHVPLRGPFGNYDMCGEVVGCNSYYNGQQCTGIEFCITGRCTPFE